MPTVTTSSKFQILIPKKVREAMRLSSGEKLQIFCYQNYLELIPIKKLKKCAAF